LLAILLQLVASSALSAETTTDRLVTVARIWGAVKFVHPFLGYRQDLDWDLAGVRAAERAKTGEPLPSVIAEMLSALGDPTTRVVQECIEQRVEPAPATGYFLLDDETLFIPMSALASSSVDPALRGYLRDVKWVIVDLRTPAGACATPSLPLLPLLEPTLLSQSAAPPDERVVFHNGYRSQYTGLWTPYQSRFNPMSRVVSGGAGANEKASAVFVVDTTTALPPLALALLREGRARLVSVGEIGEEIAVRHLRVATGEGYAALIRAGELGVQGKAFTVGAAVTLPPGATLDEVLAASLDLTRMRRRAVRVIHSRPLPRYEFRLDSEYAEMKYPNFGYRALAAFRLWNVVHYFYAYLHLIDDWDARLPEVIEVLVNASSQREYDLALARIMTWVPDGHSRVYSAGFMELRGTVQPPFFAMPVEGKPVVVELTDPTASGPIAVGDEIIAVDGRPVAERYAELEPYVSASTEAAKAYYITTYLALSPQPSEASLTMRRPDGSVHETVVRRDSYEAVAPRKPWRILPGNIGYVDLRWLEISQVDIMIRDIMGTRGLIIDLRTYPLGVFGALGRRLNTKGLPAHVARIRIPQLMGGERGEESFPQDIGSSTWPVFKGKTVTLIDERAQSQSEHTALVLEALNGTTFVGSPTVGANGNVTYMVMPGRVYILFTGMDVRHLDGRQLQRVGILPDVEVPRTVRALSEGTDEVLDRAIQILSQ
jgi:C-terminal processing protease CtpA/Prc